MLECNLFDLDQRSTTCGRPSIKIYAAPVVSAASVYCMRMLSIKTANQTCGSMAGSACRSRTEAMQQMKYLELNGGRNSLK